MFDKEHYKYSDQLRKNIFISPHHPLDIKIHQKIFEFSFMIKMFKNRLSLLERADNIIMFLINSKDSLEEFALTDIFFYLML